MDKDKQIYPFEQHFLYYTLDLYPHKSTKEKYKGNIIVKTNKI